MTSRNPIVAISKFNLQKCNETIQFFTISWRYSKISKLGLSEHGNHAKLMLLAAKTIIYLQNIFLNNKSWTFIFTYLKCSITCPIQNPLQFKSNLKLVCIVSFLINVFNSSYDRSHNIFECWPNHNSCYSESLHTCHYI